MLALLGGWWTALKATSAVRWLLGIPSWVYIGLAGAAIFGLYSHYLIGIGEARCTARHATAALEVKDRESNADLAAQSAATNRAIAASKRIEARKKDALDAIELAKKSPNASSVCVDAATAERLRRR